MKILWNILNFHRLLNKLIWFYFFSHKKDYTIKTLSCLLRGHSPQTQTDVEGQSCIGNVEQQTIVTISMELKTLFLREFCVQKNIVEFDGWMDEFIHFEGISLWS